MTSQIYQRRHIYTNDVTYIPKTSHIPHHPLGYPEQNPAYFDSQSYPQITLGPRISDVI